MTEGGIKYADTIGMSILFCLQQKKYIKEHKKKQKLSWNTDAGIELGPFA